MESAPATVDAARWSGWGTALKPGHEPICVARKPLAGTVEANVRRYGTGAINVDGCRIGDEGGGTKCGNRDEHGRYMGHGNAGRSTAGETIHGPDTQGGRWPANVVIDEEAAAMIDAQSGRIRAAYSSDASAKKYNDDRPEGDGRKSNVFSRASAPGAVYADDGGASRFFYVAKASNSDRGEENIHETVKPLSLMRWLVRLVTPPGGLVLDPFAGSGTTGLAAMAEGMSAILVEREADYVSVIRSRLAGACEVVEGDGRREATERKRKKREQIGLFG